MIDKHNKHGGRRPGAGRKRTPSNMMRQAIDNDAQNLPKYFVRLSELALKGDKEALQYLIDRHLGKPKQQTDIDLKGGEGLGLTALKVLIEGMARRKIELESPDPLREERDARQREATQITEREHYAVQIQGTGQEGKDGQYSQGEDEALP